jgi:DNA-binding CsgD family transcriptional regulator
MDKDFSPLILVLSGVFFTIGVRRFSLGNLRPIPRHGLYEWLEDAIVILDQEERIVDLNRVARELFSAEGSHVLGNSLASLFPSMRNTLPALADLGEDFPIQWHLKEEVVDGVLRVRKLTRNRGEDAVGYSVVIQKTIPVTSPSTERLLAAPLKLTRKERQILDLVIQDLSNKEIAERLNVTESTVKSHVHNLLKKADVKQRSDLTKDFFEN